VREVGGMLSLLVRPELEAPLSRQVESAIAVEVDGRFPDGVAPRLTRNEVVRERSYEVEHGVRRVLLGGGSNLQ